MAWSQAFNNSSVPTNEDIQHFVSTDLWDQLNLHLQHTYSIQPQMFYSACSMQKGWNVKYKKKGKSLCTLYPMRGFFIALIVIGPQETIKADLLIPLCSRYTQNIYHQTPFGFSGKWLMLNITDEKILQDAKHLISIRFSS